MENSLDKKTAFTLVEMLVVICIFAIIAAGLGTVLFSGVKLWHKFSRTDYADNQLLLELEALNANLRSIVQLEKFKFSGNQSSLTFAAVNGGVVFWFNYTFEPSTQTCWLQKNNLTAIIGGQKLKEPVVVFKASDLVFDYYYYNSTNRQFLWLDQIANITPTAVRIRANTTKNSWEREVFIPLNYSL